VYLAQSMKWKPHHATPHGVGFVRVKAPPKTSEFTSMISNHCWINLLGFETVWSTGIPRQTISYDEQKSMSTNAEIGNATHKIPDMRLKVEQSAREQIIERAAFGLA